MKVTKFEGTPEEFKAVEHLFSDTPIPEKTSPIEVTKGEVERDWVLDKKVAIRAMLTRRPIPKGQKDVYKALSDGELSHTDLLKKTGRTAAEHAGVLGALGRRINATNEIHQADLPCDVHAVINYRKLDDGTYFLSLTPDAQEALKEEGII